MTKTRARHSIFIFAFLICPGVDSGLRAQDLTPLKSEIANIIAEYHGEVGVAIEHIESQNGFSINGHRRFPLASIYKLGILAEVFHQAADGKFSLHDRVELVPEIYNPWGQVISHFEPGLRPTVRDLMYWMVVETDNMATDILLQKVGAGNVRAYLRTLGLKEFSVDRTTKVLILDYCGYSGDKYYGLSGEALKSVMGEIESIALQREKNAAEHAPLPASVVKFQQDPRDTGSPIDVNRLVIKMFNGQVVSKEASKEMIDIMLDTRTGEGKIKGLLPPGTPVAHKTGDWPTSNNDTGIVYLPGNRGHLAITVLDKDMDEAFSTSSKMSARIARAAYDFFLNSN